MVDRNEFLIFGRRIHNALRHAIEDGDGRKDDKWINDERPLFEHSLCGLYLAGCLSFLEGKYGVRSWSNATAAGSSLDSFIRNLPDHSKNEFVKFGVSEAGLDALICIRNAFTHNDNDLSKNTDNTCLSKVSSISIPGVTINGTLIKLSSNEKVDFMEHVRMSVVAVSMYYGDG